MRRLAFCLVVFGPWATGACTADTLEPPAARAGSSGSGAASAGAGTSPGGTAGGTLSAAGAAAGGVDTGVAGSPGGGGAGAAGTVGGGGTTGSSAGNGGTGGNGGAAANPDPTAPCPKCVRIFNGKDFDGWEAAPSTWSIIDGAMRGSGGSSRAAFTKVDYDNFRLIVTSRMNPVNGDHLGILFWGSRPTSVGSPEIDHAGWMQWMPPSGTMWSYPKAMHHVIKPMVIAPSPSMATVWSTAELLFNLDKGTLRAAVDGVETTFYEHAKVNPDEAIVKGPLAMMRHGGGASEYKDIFVEVDPAEDRLLTLK